MTPALTSVVATLPLIGGVLGGVGWRLSSMLLSTRRAVTYPDRVLEVRDGEVWLAHSRWAELPGQWGLRWSDGLVIVGPVPEVPEVPGVPGVPGVLASDEGTLDPSGATSDPPAPLGSVIAAPVRRPVLAGLMPPAGVPVVFDAGLHDADPGALGLEFSTVAVHTPIGDCPAWLVPGGPQYAGDAGDARAGGDGSGAADTWVLTVHGRGADRRECLRVLPELHRLGHPVLAVSYRNDPGAPPSPDGHYHLGDTEWVDLEAAVGYACAGGAARVVLYGWSMGAAITGAFLSRSPLAARVAAVVWDAPLLDWRATLRQQAALRGLPAGLTPLAAAVTRLRIGIDFGRFDLLRRPPAVRPPTLLFHGTHDTAVPLGPARALAAAAATLDWPLRYVEVPGAEHTASWNVDPEGYQDTLASFLLAHAAPGSGRVGGTAPTPSRAQWHDGRRD